MAISFFSKPNAVTAVYLPVKYILETDRFPNTRVGESTVINLTGAVFGDPSQTTILMNAQLKRELITPLIVGDTIFISNSKDGKLDGVHTITGIGIDPAIINIDFAYPYATTVNNNGDIAIYYDKLSIVLDVFVNGQLRHRTRRQANPNGQYDFDLSDTIRLAVGSDLQDIGVDTLGPGSDSIANFYINYAEEYIVFDATKGDELILQSFLSDITNVFQSVNSVIQYVDIRNFSINSTTYDLSDYIITPASVGKFLTKQPDKISIGELEDYQLMAVIQKDNINIFGNSIGATGDFEDGILPTKLAGVTTPPLGNFLVTETNPRSGAKSLRVKMNGLNSKLWESQAGGTSYATDTQYTISGWVKFDVAPSTNKEDYLILIGTSGFSDGTTSVVKSVDPQIENKADTWYYLETTLLTGTDVTGEFILDADGADRPNLNNVILFFDDFKVQQTAFEIQRKVIERDSAGGTTTTLTDLTATNNTYIISAGTNNLTLLGTTVGYDVVLIDKATTLDISNLLTFDIDTKCTRNELRFAWLNDKGGIDQYTFRGELVETDEVARQTFKRELSDVRTIPERQITEAWVRPQTVFSIGSGLVNLDTVEWLKGIYRSPEKYIIVDGQYLPIFIRDTSPDISKSSDRLHNLTIEFIFAFDEIVQQN